MERSFLGKCRSQILRAINMRTEIEISKEYVRLKRGEIKNDERYLKGYEDALSFVLRD